MNYFIHMLLYLLRCEEYFSVIKCTYYIIDCVQGLEFFHYNFYIIRLEKNHFGPKSILLCTNRKWGFLQCTFNRTLLFYPLTRPQTLDNLCCFINGVLPNYERTLVLANILKISSTQIRDCRCDRVPRGELSSFDLFFP